MKHIAAKLAAVSLVFALLVSSISVGALAASTQVKHYTSVVSFGDSIAAGFSLPDYKAKEEGGRHMVARTRVEGAYPTLVADAVGATTLVPMAQPGFRTEELRALLCEDYDGDYVTKSHLGNLAKQVGGVEEAPDYSQQSFSKQRGEYIAAAKEADLVLLDIGENDSMMSFLGMISEIAQTGDRSRKEPPENGLEGYRQAGEQLVSQVKNMDELVARTQRSLTIIFSDPGLTSLLKETLHKVFDGLTSNYKIIVERIYELNPDVTIVAVGNYNPFHQWKGLNGDTAQFAKLIQLYYDYINDYKQAIGSGYKGQYYFVDVSETPLISDSLKTVLKTRNFDSHPTEAGHRHMAEQILKVLLEA